MGQKITKRWFWRKKTTNGIPIQNDTAEKWRDIAIRAGKTAIQAFLAALPITVSALEGGKAVWRSALIGAIAAGISAGMNVIIAALSDDTMRKEDG